MKKRKMFFNMDANKNSQEHARIVLAGQPNCGKSTLFNEVAGYSSVTSNFSGATVEYAESHIKVDQATYDIVDLPGTYSLTSLDEAERETLCYLLSGNADVIINVVDASLLSRSLELTLQLMELEQPMILCLNMIDEAERKGIIIDQAALSEKLGIPVVATVASKGTGLTELFIEAKKAAAANRIPPHISGNLDVEELINDMIGLLGEIISPGTLPVSTHLLVTKLLEDDPHFQKMAEKIDPKLLDIAEQYKGMLEAGHGKTADEVIAAERHILSMSIFEQVSVVAKPKIGWRDRLDDVLMHNVWGYVFLVGSLLLFFLIVFKLGSLTDGFLAARVGRLTEFLLNIRDLGPVMEPMARGILDGIGGGFVIVVAYLFPFMLGLAILEDSGYLPRIAFLMDVFMHRIGLHGKAIIPAVLGYSCNVPAVMGTRMLDSRRDRFIAATIAAMVPCAARMMIISGLAGAYLGGTAAFFIYFLNVIVIGIVGRVLSKLMPEVSPGMAFEIPAYQLPGIDALLKKTWFRLKDFITIAWPLLIAGSIILSLIDFLQLGGYINTLLSPITYILGLPAETGITLIFGVLRKELSMMMLYQALGTSNIGEVLTNVQILTFTVFVVFYIPCVATIGALVKQVRWRMTRWIILITFLLALVLGLLARGTALLIW